MEVEAKQEMRASHDSKVGTYEIRQILHVTKARLVKVDVPN